MKRRSFIEFLGGGVLAYGLAPGFMMGCKSPEKVKEFSVPFTSIDAVQKDELLMADGFNYDVLISWGDKINETESFGFNNDFTAFIPLNKSGNEGLLWVNHEYHHPIFTSGNDGSQPITKEQVEMDMDQVGGSIIRIKKDGAGKWNLVAGDAMNRRLTAKTEIPFNWPEEIMGSKSAIGTMSNCSGGVTPWGTILTCEENYDMYYGERDFSTGVPEGVMVPGVYGWERFIDYPTEHYGWVVEVNVRTGEAQKHVGLGRCAHECATMKELADKRLVVYTGDDSNDECFYKFVGSKPRSLTEGTLYVANIEKQRWESLDWETRPELKDKFKNQTEVLIRLREASKLVGGSLLDRPEDIEIDPFDGSVLVSLTNNKPKGNFMGSIMKLREKDGKHDAMEFESETYLAGGVEMGFCCPDNMAFDPAGNLWITSDISGSEIGNEVYSEFGNNGLYVIPRHGVDAGKVFQVASAPTDAELTGPYFSPDGKTLFLSVQHPGEGTTDINNPTSHWPGGGNSVPKPSVVCISGPSLEALTTVLTT